MITSDVENYLGYADGVMGPTMMADFRRQAERFGAEFVTDDVTRVDFSERPFRVYVGSDEHRADSIIVATGASARQLGLPSEQTLQGRGVSYCATCDGAFFDKGPWGRGRRRLGDGGGDVPHPVRQQGRDHPPATSSARRRSWSTALRENEKVEFVLNAAVDEVLGESTGHVTGLRLRDTETGGYAEIEQTVCSSPSVTTRRRRCSSTGSITTTRAIS